MAYEFTDKYKTGIESIDAEHSHFFDLINEGVKALDQPDEESIRTAKDILGKLTDYAMTHLANEEVYMRSTNDSTLLIQLPLHQDFLTEWLVQHILKMDKKIPVR